MSLRKFFVFLLAIHALISSSVMFAENIRNLRPYEFQKEDRKLNITYKKIMRKLDSTRQDRLKNAQRVWIAFRDMDCKWAFKGSPLICITNRTKSRTRELEDTYSDDVENHFNRSK